jgi:hypothetical protein
MKMKSSNLLIFICSLLLAAPIAFCQSDPIQGPPPGLPSAPKLPAVTGKITEISDDGLTIKTTQGDSATVKVSAETRFRRDPKEAHLADFKIGDTVTILGEQDANGTWTARLVATGPDTSKADRGGLFGGPPPDPQDMGKTFIVGELKKIEDSKLTIRRPDGVDQTTQVDANTKFLDARGETVKLADFKPGDHISGIGGVKDGVVVLTECRKAPDLSAPPPPPPLPAPPSS